MYIKKFYTAGTGLDWLREVENRSGGGEVGGLCILHVM